MNALPIVSFPPQASRLTPERAERAERRAWLREFLRSVPAEDAGALFELPMPDGRLRQISRGELAARIRLELRPRMKRILERYIIAHLSRAEVTEELGCSTKTLERDLGEALDILLAPLVGE